MFEVEKNVKMKEIPRKENFKRKYPFDEMGVGDSFIVPLESKEKVRVACFNEGVRKKKKFSLGMDEDGNIRCWRLK